jgi:hypothetical protein
MTEHAPGLLKDGQTLFVSGGQEEKISSITRGGVSDVASMYSNQEEADPRIVLHAIAAAENGAQTVVVRSPDTDILALLVHHRPAIKAKEIFFLTS